MLQLFSWIFTLWMYLDTLSLYLDYQNNPDTKIEGLKENSRTEGVAYFRKESWSCVEREVSFGGTSICSCCIISARSGKVESSGTSFCCLTSLWKQNPPNSCDVGRICFPLWWAEWTSVLLSLPQLQAIKIPWRSSIHLQVHTKNVVHICCVEREDPAETQQFDWMFIRNWRLGRNSLHAN